MIWIATPSENAELEAVVYVTEASEDGEVALGAGATQHGSKADLEAAYPDGHIIWPDIGNT
jgi:hypothetical protein